MKMKYRLLFLLIILYSCNSKKVALDYYNTGMDYYNDKNFQMSKENMIKAIEKDKNLLKAKAWLSNIHQMESNNELAIKLCEEVVNKSKDKNLINQCYSTIIYCKNSIGVNIEEDFADWQNKLPLESRSHGTLANIYWEKNNYKEAEKSIKRAIKLDDKNAYYHYVLSEINWYNAMKGKIKLDEVIKNLDEAIELDPKNNFYKSRRGGVYYELNKFEKAITDFEEVIKNEEKQELDIEIPRTYQLLGICLIKLDRIEEGCIKLNKSIELGDQIVNKELYEKCK